MRSNGFPLALATLLLPACVLAQEAPAASAAPTTPQVTAPAVTADADPAAASAAPQDTPVPAAPAPQPAPAEPVAQAPVAPSAPDPTGAEVSATDVQATAESPVERPVATPIAAEPAAADPTAADPTAADPTAADPTAADPTAADPTATDPTAADPTAADPTAADPTAADPTADPAATEPAAASDPAGADPAATDPAALPPTEAEQEFAEIYGEEYDPVADPSLPEPVNLPGAYDPWEKYNRQMHRFNNAVDRGVAKPLARGYVKVVPRPLRLGVSNFFSNLGQPLAAVNSLLQGKPKQAGQALGRFLLNSTLGIGGIFDPASDAKLPHRNEDFGQTLGVWGWKRSRYVELPLFGPRTVRDVLGMVGDAPLSPLRNVEADRLRVPLQGLQLVDLRAQLLSTDSLREGAEDDYTLVRDAWSQRRDFQIFGDRSEGDDSLPEYLREGETEPTVPLDAMPVPPTGGGI